jgi:hypothetical protein
MNGGERRTLGVCFDLLFEDDGKPTPGAVMFLLEQVAQHQVFVFPRERVDSEDAARAAALLQGRVYRAIRRFLIDLDHPDDKGCAVAAMEYIDFFVAPQICDVRIDTAAGLAQHTLDADADRILAAMKAAGLAAIAFLLAVSQISCTDLPL